MLAWIGICADNVDRNEMKIAPRTISIFLPLFIVPLVFVTYLAVTTSRTAITGIATNFLQFKTNELLRFASSERALLVNNNLEDSHEFITAAQRAVANYATGLIGNPPELIIAFDKSGVVQFSTAEVSLTPNEMETVSGIIASHHQGWIELPLDGTMRVANVATFTPFGWTLFVTQERKVFFAAIDQIRWEAALTGAISMIAVIILVILFSRLLTLPLSQVAGAMHDIVKTGDLHRRVEVRYSDEVGELGETFNSMTGALEQAYGEIKNYALQAAIAQKREMKIRNVFQKYVPNQVIEQFFRAPESMLVGEERTLAILFSDIRGFTEMSERMQSKDIVESLNRYFERMVDAIMRNQGLVDKYIGDAIMAFFGAPAVDEESAYHSVVAGLDMIDELVDFNTWQRSRGWAPIRNGIGINYGNVTIGNIGTERKMDYTVVGDMVNVASRLEGLTKFYDERILISESIYRYVRNKIPCRQIDRVQVKGRRRGLAIYAVRREVETTEEKAWKLHARGLSYYYNRDFEDALHYFESADRLVPDDPITRIFLMRCKNYLEDAPPADWNGVTAFETK